MRKNIVLYGLSTETERVIKDWNGQYNIMGLLDSFRKTGEQYGFPILDIEDVVLMSDIKVVVVARPGSCKAIAKNIGDLCREHDIELIDIRGKNLLETVKITYDFKDVEGYTRSSFLCEAHKHDVISFDLFDTLIVRRVTSFEDVLLLIDEKLRNSGTVIEDFVSKRIASEKMLSQGAAPKLADIYENCGFEVPAEKLATLEFETDFSLIKPRVEMIRFLDELRVAGKKVFITTDTYYSRTQIKAVLEMCQIEIEDENIIISSENNIGKKDGLFEVLKIVSESNSILHIGDDQLVDVDSAKKYGIDGLKIYSCTELMDMLGGLGTSEFESSISDRIRIGGFSAQLFNNPFLFESADRKLSTDSAYDIGYLFCAPIIYDFTLWFGKYVLDNGIKNVLFGARDGFLIKRIFEILYPELPATYFLTSRISAIRAGCDCADDIRYVDSMKFSGSLEDNLRVRFGIDATRLCDGAVDNETEDLLKFTDIILKQAGIKKKNNLRYIESLKLQDGETVFFDFVAKGTSQYFVEKILDRKAVGLYFLQLEPEFMKDKALKIIPFYTEAERDSSAIFDSYYILETILTSPDSSVDEFDSSGNPVYSDETRSKEDVECIMEIQRGILDYVKDMISTGGPKVINKKLDETLFGMLQNISVTNKCFLELNVEDPFFNRNTSIVDVI